MSNKSMHDLCYASIFVVLYVQKFKKKLKLI